MEIVLNAPGIRRAMEISVRAGEGDEQTLQERARKYFLEIASDFDEGWLSIWEKVLNRLFSAIYNDFIIDQSGIAKIREIALRMPFVTIPCHRSHVDYLIFSYILYKHGIPLPYIAAGNNMNFWPLGSIFRQSGAFFLRRSFRGNDLYAEVFATYLATLLREGASIEFFLEGGRSRTGKMAAPRYGMLSTLIRAYQENVCDDLALIPVFLGYDRLIEENSFVTELKGIPKKRESILDVLKNMRVLGKRYGHTYINIGTPIFLKAYFASQQKNFADMTYDERQSLYRNIGCRIIREINRASVITPVALLAAAFLCRAGKESSEDLLLKTFNAFYDYLDHKKVNLAPALSAREKALPAMLELFYDAGYISKIKRGNGQEESVVYLLANDKRLNLEYYKNNVIHHFLPISFVSACILVCRENKISLSRIEEGYGFLKRTFRWEFFFEGDDDGGMAGALLYLKECDLLNVAEEEGIWRLVDEGCREKLKPFAGLIGSYLESYWVTFNAASHLKNELMVEKAWLNYIRTLAEDMYEKGDILRVESLSQENYVNALKFLREEDVINFAGSPGGNSDEDCLIVADETRMETLRLRLSNFMYCAKT